MIGGDGAFVTEVELDALPLCRVRLRAQETIELPRSAAAGEGEMEFFLALQHLAHYLQNASGTLFVESIGLFIDENPGHHQIPRPD